MSRRCWPRRPATASAIEGLSLHSYTGEHQPGLVLGHARMADAAIERGVALLRHAAAGD